MTEIIEQKIVSGCKILPELLHSSHALYGVFSNSDVTDDGKKLRQCSMVISSRKRNEI